MSNELWAALVGAIAGGMITYLGAVGIARRAEDREAKGIRLQLRLMLREVYAFVIVRARGQGSGGSGGYNFESWTEALSRLASRPYDTEVWAALDEEQAKKIYDAAMLAKAILVEAQELAENAKAGKHVLIGHYIGVWDHAWSTLDTIAKARQALGDTIIPEDLADISKHLEWQGDDAT